MSQRTGDSSINATEVEHVFCSPLAFVLAVLPACGSHSHIAWLLGHLRRRAADLRGRIPSTDRLGPAHVLADRLQGGLFSSWDRNSKTHWGANGDAGQYLRVEPNGEAVMMDIDGPGVIYRIWSANPMGKIRIYLDGATDAQLRVEFSRTCSTASSARSSSRWCTGATAPSRLPTAICRSRLPSTSRSPPTKRMASTTTSTTSLFPKDSAGGQLSAAADRGGTSRPVGRGGRLVAPGRDPKPKLPGQQTIAKTITIAPGQTAELCALQTTGVIRAIRARVQSTQRYAWRKLVLRGVWDDAPVAADPDAARAVLRLRLGDGGVRFRRQRAAGTARPTSTSRCPSASRPSSRWSSYLEQPATVEFEIEWAPLTQLPEDCVLFLCALASRARLGDVRLPVPRNGGARALRRRVHAHRPSAGRLVGRGRREGVGG